MRKRRQVHVLLFIVFTSAALPLAPRVASVPGDPYIPDVSTGRCEGGKGLAESIVYCDGLKFPDGSYWREIVDVASNKSKVVCLVDHGDPLPWAAPPGGCGGTVASEGV
jgi:hypothetical protein